MKLLSFLLVLLGIPSLRAQQNGIDQSLDLVTLPTGKKVIRWYGHIGRSYFVQVSKIDEPLKKWDWAPIIEGGNDREISHEVNGTPVKGFFRLKYTDQVPGSGKTLDTADFDDDGLSNLSEITATSLTDPQTDPLNPDSDGDGMQDGWEVASGFDPANGDENGDGIPDSAGDSDGDGLTNAQEEALRTDPKDYDSDDDGLGDGEEVQLGTDPNTPDSDEDGLEDGEDADPRDNAITWRPASEPGYAFVEIEGWDENAHGQPIMTNKKGQVLCHRAVWEAESWTTLSGVWTGMDSPPVVITNTYKSGPESTPEPIELYTNQATSIDDNGAIAGYASGDSSTSYWGKLPLAWSTADDASPVALGVPNVIVGGPSNYDEEDNVHVNRDGVFTLVPTSRYDAATPIHTMRRYLASSPLVATAASPSNLRCYGNSTVGRLSRDGTCVGITYGDNQPWVWRGSGTHEIISVSNTDVPLYYPDIAQAPISLSGEIGCIGTTPPTGGNDNGPEHPGIILGGSVLIHNGTKWVKSKSLQGATALSKSGTALTYLGADPAVWRNTKVAKLKDLCRDIEDRNITDFTTIDINDQGIILIKYQAPPPASNDTFRIGLLIPIDVRGFSLIEADEPVGTVGGVAVIEKYSQLVPDSNDSTGYRTESRPELKIAQWDGVIHHLNSQWQFSDSDFSTDEDIFRIRFPKAILPPAPGKHQFKVSTVNAADGDVDLGATVELEESGDFFQSDALCLVADPTDDTHTVLGKGDGVLNDHTYLAELGGKVRIEWLTAPGSGGNPVIFLPIPVRKVVTAQGYILQKGSLFQSDVTNRANTIAYFEHAKRMLATCGVKLEYDVSVVSPNPAGVDFGSGPLSGSTFEGPGWASNNVVIPGESKALMNDSRLKPPANVIPVYFVGNLRSGTGEYAGLTAVNSSMIHPTDDAYANAVFLDAMIELPLSTLSHELMHVLLDAVHVGPNELYDYYHPKPYIIWYTSNTSPAPEIGVTARKRICDSMRSRLLKSKFCRNPLP